MTNLQQSAPRLSGRLLRRLWFWTPLGAGAMLASLLAGALLIPQWLAYQRDSERLRQLEALRQEVLLMRGQLASMDQNEARGEQQKTRLIDLITGRGDVSTVLAMLDREARDAGVRLDLFEPQAAAPPPAAPPPAAAQGAPPAAAPPPAPGGPVEIEGLQRRTVLMSARGTYPALVKFLRRLESLSLLVAQNDLSVTLDEPKTNDPKAPVKPADVVLKLSFSFYVRPPGEAPAPAQPPPGQPAPAPAPPSP